MSGDRYKPFITIQHYAAAASSKHYLETHLSPHHSLIFSVIFETMDAVDAFFCQQSLIGVIFTFFWPSLIIDLWIPTK
jgi:hypothetical protein